MKINMVPDQSRRLPTYPAYAGEVATWKQGLQYTDSATYVGAGGTSVGWIRFFQPLPLFPGDYTLTGLNAAIAFTGVADCDDIRLQVWRSDGAGWVRVADVDTPDGAPQSSTHQLSASGLSTAFTVADDGETYYWVLAMHKLEGSGGGRPGTKRMNDGMGPDDSMVFFTSADSTTLAVGDRTLDAQLHILGEITFTTANRILYRDAGYTVAAKRMIPRCTTANYWIKINNAIVVDGEAWTCQLDRRSGGDESTLTTLVLDMGATDQVTFGAANVALAGAGAEAGDTFDIGIAVRPVSGKMDCFFLNKSDPQGAASRPMTRSHACANGAARAAEYTITEPYFLDMSGTAATGAIEVGREMLVMVGDSQSFTGACVAQRLAAYLPAAFIHDRILWAGGNSGQALASMASLYKAATAGEGDLCEMTSAVLVVAGAGINDLVGINAVEAARNAAVATALGYALDILTDWVDRDLPVLAIGLPPYSRAASSATEEEAGGVRQFNRGLGGVALALRLPFLDPWPLMVVSGTQGDAIPTFIEAYTDDSGLHYSNTGAAIVAAAAAAALESATVSDRAVS